MALRERRPQVVADEVIAATAEQPDIEVKRGVSLHQALHVLLGADLNGPPKFPAER
jgi:hypothetical protein